MDQRTCIKFCVKNESKCADAFRMLTVAYGEANLDRSNVYRWYKIFSEGREDVNDEERAGRPSTSTTDEKTNEVEKMILANRRITVREVAEDLNISIGSCHSNFINDFGMRRVATKFVPKLLNCDQKHHRMNIANEMLDSVRDDPNLLQRVITGDEAWVCGYDVETKAQSSQWKLPHEPRPKKARQVRSNVKDLLTVFFDCRGVVHHEFLPQGRTVNMEYYLQVMRNLREAIRQKARICGRKKIGFCTTITPLLTHRCLKQQRANETPIERERRLANLRERFSVSHASETEQQREARLKSNGKIKRLHRTLKAAIRAHNSIGWTETLLTVLLGLRSAVREDTNYSIAEMIYGEKIKLPGDFFCRTKNLNPT
ncbi:hypothetical protein LAZ67_X002630 [Cordylochernes scorpioides]|uniref:Mos1 transposase HTH domain-containing protein n=1 Tax=Cordylochernes scorpioides TaxID=51811 RepID=A0ABY6LTJ6_9ARAC|nr:hypothetical protein LAZ67_X002630 [Cordylochernes scorpioides]